MDRALNLCISVLLTTTTMFLCLIPFLVVAATAALCPYEQAEKRSPRAYMNANSNSESLTRSLPAIGKKGVFFMTRNAPVSSKLYVANADGSNARSLLGNNTVFEHDAQWAPDGEWIILSSQRNGDGNPQPCQIVFGQRQRQSSLGHGTVSDRLLVRIKPNLTLCASIAGQYCEQNL
jgi:hypothetical protein